MAPRKPKGIDLPSPSDVVNWMRGVHDTAMVASGDRAPVSPGDTGVRNLGRGISMLNQGINPYARTTEKALGYAVGKPGSGTQLMKSMATDAAITAAAAGATYGAMKAAGKVAESGIPNRISNAIKGETILLHGSPSPNLKSIQPRLGSAHLPNEEVAFGWNPKSFFPDDAHGLTQNVLQYTGNLSTSQASGFTRLRGTMRSPSSGGSIYVTRGKTAQNALTNKNEKFMMAIKGEMPVVQEFKVSNYVRQEPTNGASYIDRSGLTKDITAALKSAGAKVQPNIAQKMLNEIEAARMARRSRIANKRSVV